MPRTSSCARRASSGRPLVVGAAALAAAIFAVDLTTTAGFGIGALYVIPLLLGTLTGPPRAGMTSAASSPRRCVAGGLLKAPLAATPWFVVANRGDRADGDLDDRLRHRPLARGVDPSRGAHARPRRRELRAGKIGDRRGHRRARHHQIRQRQVLRDLEILAGGAARAGPPDPELRLSPEGVHPRSVDDDRQRPHLARRDPQPRQGRIALLGRHDDRAVPERATASRTRYMAIRYEITGRKDPRSGCRSRRRWRGSGRWRPSSRTRSRTRSPGSAARCRSSPRACRPDSRDRAVMGDIITRLDGLNGVVQDLLVFARPRELRTESVDLANLIGTRHRTDAPRSGLRGDRDAASTGRPSLAQADPGPAAAGRPERADECGAGDERAGADHDHAVGCRRPCRRSRSPTPGPACRRRCSSMRSSRSSRPRAAAPGLGLPLAKRIIDAHGGAIASRHARLRRHGGHPDAASRCPVDRVQRRTR